MSYLLLVDDMAIRVSCFCGHVYSIIWGNAALCPRCKELIRLPHKSDQ